MGEKELVYSFFFSSLFETNINHLLCLTGTQAWCYPTMTTDAHPSPILLFGATSCLQGWVSSQNHPLARGHHPAPVYTHFREGCKPRSPERGFHPGVPLCATSRCLGASPHNSAAKGWPHPRESSPCLRLLGPERCRCCRLGGCRVSGGCPSRSVGSAGCPKCWVP